MTAEQATIFGLLVVVLALFIWGRWRYDIIALAALLVAVVTGRANQRKETPGRRKRTRTRYRLPA